MSEASANPVDPLVALLVKHEGLRQSPYRDSRGNLTVGVGHNLVANPITPPPSYPLSVAQCFKILAIDIATAEDELTLALGWFPAIDTVRQAAITDLCFNVGLRALLGFHRFLGFAELGNWDAAASDLLETLWATQVPSRATDVAWMIRTGKWP